ncbi:hypothetical protein ABPG72_013345 [Tetrahymena utriculariae]
MAFYNDDHSQINESWILTDNQNALLAIRVILFILVDAIWWFQIYDSKEVNFLNLLTNFQYLTLWGVNLLHFYLIFVLIDMIYFRVKSQKLANLWKLEHFIFQFGFATSLTIFLLFWVGIYPTLSENTKNDSWLMFINVADHGIIFVLYYVEYIINNIIFRWKQFYLTLAGCAVYMIVNIIVTFSYQKVYSIISWVSLTSYIYVVVAFLITLFHYWVGIKLYQKFKYNKIYQAQQLITPTATNVQLPAISSETNMIKAEEKA